MFAGSVGSLTVLGAPDSVVLALTEFADQAQRICRAGEVGLIVDGGGGCGNAQASGWCVEGLKTAGVARVTAIVESFFSRSAKESVKWRLGGRVGRVPT